MGQNQELIGFNGEDIIIMETLPIKFLGMVLLVIQIKHISQMEYFGLGILIQLVHGQLFNQAVQLTSNLMVTLESMYMDFMICA